MQAIPAYRLPREIVAREVRMIEHMGVEIFTNMMLGEDFTLKALRAEGYDAVFLGVGAPAGVGLGMPGADAEGITDALSFLRTYNLRGSVPVGKNVVVIGGGNSAIDAARTALRLGAENVTVVYRRSREAMPAYEEEIEEAEHEGVALRLLTAPVRGRARRQARGGHQVPAHAAGRVRPLRPPPARRRRRRLRHPGRPGAGGHRPDARFAEDHATACTWNRATRRSSRSTRSPARPRRSGSSPAATPSPAPPRWSRPWRPASGRPWASTCT